MLTLFLIIVVAAVGFGLGAVMAVRNPRVKELSQRFNSWIDNPSLD